MDDHSAIQEQLPLQLCVIGDSLARDCEFINICRGFKVPVKLVADGEEEYLEDGSRRTIYVHETFSGPVFESLVAKKRPILGPSAIRDLNSRGEALLVKRSPVFCLTLYGCGIVLSGYRRKSDLERLIKMVHWCGGSVMKDTGTKMTQLVAAHSTGKKYQYATAFSIPVLTEQWLAEAWSKRDNIGHRADTKEIMSQFKLPLFAGNVVHFYGFEATELKHMQEVLVVNGGKVATSPDAPDTTHIVVDDNTVEMLPNELESVLKEGCDVVKGEWFWRSIQIDAAANSTHYRWKKDSNNAGVLSPNVSLGYSYFSPTTPMTSASNKKRKRRRQHEMMQLLAAESPAYKRRSSVTDLAMLNMSGSFLDASDPRTLDNSAGDQAVIVTPEHSPAKGVVAASTPAFDMKTATARQQVFHEFVTTETNYVSILKYVTKIAAEAEDPNQQGGALLDQQEMKIIFGLLPPILKVHTEMLKKLVAAEENWTESVTVGSIILQFAEDLLKAYPPFVNFFERTKNQIRICDQKSARFHAFLKMCERRPECSRQALPELMIRPVQRLPSTSLLLTDLLKHTRKADSTHPDCDELEKALAKIKEVMTHLNEEKRRTEGQIHIFDIYSEIENCPASVVSSHRSFVSRADCIEMSSENQLCGKGYELTMFLFTDILVIAKRKSNKGLSISRSPSTASLVGSGAGQHSLLHNKVLKFVKMVQLSSVRRLVDVMDLDDCEEAGSGSNNLIAIVCRLTEDLRERMYIVQLMVENNEQKLQFLRQFCRCVANTRCRPDPEELLAKMAASELGLDTSDLNVTGFSKAISSFNKTKQKVGRAFSFNKTPSKMKRAVSSIMSPMTTPRVVGESGTLGRINTPHHGMRELRLEVGLQRSSTPSLEIAQSGGNKTNKHAETVSPYGSGQNSDTGSSFCKVSPIVRPGTNEAITSVEKVAEQSSDQQDTPRTGRKKGLQSCVSLNDEAAMNSPVRGMGFPKRFNMKAELSLVGESPGTENEDPDFRTPNLCSRPSFRDKLGLRPRAGTLSSFSRKHSVN